MWSNPALIVCEEKRSAQFTHIDWVEGIKQEFAAFSTNSQIGHFGLGIHIFDSDDIELRGIEPSSEPDGTYSINNAALSLSYARNITESIAAGVTLKKLFEKVSIETAGGYAVDAGFFARTPVKGLSFAAAARNYGRMSKLKNDRTKLPSDFGFGFVYEGTAPKINCPLYVVGDYLIPKYGDSGVRLGVEIEPLERFFMRMGYRSDSDIEDMSFGVGLNFQLFSFDVSYTPMSEGFDNALRFTLGLTGF